MSRSPVYGCMRFVPFLLLTFACTKAPDAPKPVERVAEGPHDTTWAFASESTAPAKPIKVAVGAPIGLTASDGTGLGIARVSAKAVIDAPLAFTELHLVFDNPRDRQIEGQFRITLPERASISRFAMLTNGAWQEGEVVERQAARRAYEDFLHRRQDPALLEQQAGNEFSARIFPIPARGQKEVIIAYAEELLSEPYRIALKGLPEVGALDVRVTEGKEVAELHQKAATPDSDFVVTPHATGNVALRTENLLVARVTPNTDTSDDPTDSLFVLVDTSASRTLGRDADVALVKDLLGRLKDAPVALWAYDQTATLIDEGPASRIDVSKLEKRRPLGASSLAGALSAVAKHERKYRRGLLVSDGVVTAGADVGVDAVKATGVQRFDAIAVGGIRDRDALARLIVGDGLVIDGALEPTAIATRLNHKTRSGIKIDIPGADWVWPETLDGMQPGDSALVYADLAAAKPFSIGIGDKPIAPGTLKKTERPLLERAWVAARIKKLLDQKERTKDQDVREALTKQVVELSTTKRVLCPLTALLVLETEEDYRRFRIDRTALAGILAIEQDTVVVTQRRSPVVMKTPVVRPPHVENKKVRAATDKDEGGAPEDAAKGSLAGRRESAKMEMDDASDLKLGSADGLTRGAGGGASPGASRSAPARMAESEAPAPASAPPPPPSPPSPEPVERVREERSSNSVARPEPPRPTPVEKNEQINPYTGQFRQVMGAIRHKQFDDALAQADGWWQSSPGDVMALTALGEALEAKGDVTEAARAYGSLIDLFPARADMRRFAGLRLERLKNEAALELAADSYAKTVEQRPDHPQSHRLYAYTLLKLGQPEKAFDVLEKGARRRYPEGRFAGVDQILSEDLGIAAQVWVKSQPERKDEIYKRLANAGGRRETSPSLRFVLSWETDANDVDFHIYDSQQGHAFYGERELPSGGELYADVTTGYGPECFTIRGKARAYPYKLQAHYYSRGPMGYGMGKLEIVQHDGQGTLKFDERPFVVMQDQAFLELGTVSKPL